MDEEALAEILGSLRNSKASPLKFQKSYKSSKRVITARGRGRPKGRKNGIPSRYPIKSPATTSGFDEVSDTEMNSLSSVSIYSKNAEIKLNSNTVLRCEIFWPMDRTWYKAITGPPDEDGLQDVLYEDGLQEKLDFTKEKIRYTPLAKEKNLLLNNIS
jgi:hypothetical protein